MLSVQDIPLYNSTLIAPKVLNKDDHSTILTASQRSLSMNQREGYKNSYSLIPHASLHTLENLFTNSEHRKPISKGLCWKIYSLVLPSLCALCALPILRIRITWDIMSFKTKIFHLYSINWSTSGSPRSSWFEMNCKTLTSSIINQHSIDNWLLFLYRLSC